MKRFFGKLWDNPDFLKLWGGETVSRLGSQITAFSIPMLAALTLNASALQMGYLGAAMFLPHLLTPLFAGAWVDHHKRKPIMIAANLTRALLIGSIPTLAFLHLLRMEHLYAACFLIGIAQVFFELAYHAYFPTLIERGDLVEANGKVMSSISFAEIGGPALAGFLVEWITAPFALIADSISYFVSVAATAQITKPENLNPSSLTMGKIIENINDGFGIVTGIPHLRALAGEATTFNLFAVILQTVFTLYATRELGLTPATLGLIWTVASFGSLAGAALSDKASKRFGLGKAMMGSFLLASIPHLFLLFLGDSKPLNITLLTFAFILTGMGISTSQVFIWSIRQSVTPEGKMGRMNAAYRFFVTGVTPIGSLIGGYLGETIGLRMTVWVGAMGILLILPWVFISPLPVLQALPEKMGLSAQTIPAPAD